MFGGLTHEPAVRLAERLVATGPGSTTCSSPTPARSRSRSRSRWRSSTGTASARRLLTVRGGYHGDTFGAMAVCDPVGGMHSLFARRARRARLRAAPPRRVDAASGRPSVTRLVERHAHELAGVIVEPVVQGAGGMRFYAPECVRLLRELCDEHGAAADPRRDRDRLRAHRRAVRRRARGRRAGHHVRRQGADRRLHDARGDAVHGRAWRSAIDGPLMHGPTFMANPLARAPSRSPRPSLLAGRRLARRRRADRARPARRARARARRASPTSACWARSASIQLDRPGRHGGRDAQRRSSTACGCARSAT